MHNTEPFTPTASGPPTLREEVTELAPLLMTFVVAFAAAAAVVTLAGAILATPYLLVRHLRVRLASRRHVAHAPAPIATVVAAGAAR